MRNAPLVRNRSTWPNAVQAVTPFVSTDNQNFSLFVNLFDYAIVETLQITSITKTLFTVTDIIVNGEFRPTLSLANVTPWIVVLRFPKPMNQGMSFFAVLRAPAIPTLSLGSCYPKPPVSLVISTNYGEFAFKAGVAIRIMPSSL